MGMALDPPQHCCAISPVPRCPTTPTRVMSIFLCWQVPNAIATETYAAGSLVINSPGTDHAVASDEGCLVLIIWEKPVVIHNP
jgi:hypothetical protein